MPSLDHFSIDVHLIVNFLNNSSNSKVACRHWVDCQIGSFEQGRPRYRVWRTPFLIPPRQPSSFNIELLGSSIANIFYVREAKNCPIEIDKPKMVQSIWISCFNFSLNTIWRQVSSAVSHHKVSVTNDESPDRYEHTHVAKKHCPMYAFP